MKILFINSLYAPNFRGGAERSIQFLAEKLFEWGHSVVVISHSLDQEDRVSFLNGVKVYYLKVRNFYTPDSKYKAHRLLQALWYALDTLNPFMIPVLRRILKFEKPDIINTNNLAGISLSAWIVTKQFGLPLIHTLRDHYLLCPGSTMFRGNANCKDICLRCLPFALPKRILSNMVDVTLGISNYILDRHLRSGYFLRTKKLVVIGNAYRATSSKDRPDTPIFPLRFGFLGRLHFTKGVELFLGCAKEFSKDTALFIVAGTGTIDYESYLTDHYNNDNIKYLGYVPPAQLLSIADVLVAPSVWNEPFGRMIIEAFAHGVPVIASKRGGLNELIEEGRTGFLFDPEKDSDLMIRIQEFVNLPDSIKRMRFAAYEKAIEFQPDIIAKKFLDVVHSLI
ncbi:MAG: glycosyltransferase [Desulfobacteraceae bacterium]|nr:MAG: glycosyltransferase [Desulfobacteraceae bacterium]